MIVNLKRARGIALSASHEIGTEQAGIINAFNKTLAQTISVQENMPFKDLAATDGFAVIAADTNGATKSEPVKSSLLANSVSIHTRIEQQTTVRVAQGDILPLGANAVVPLEHVYKAPDSPEILIRAEVAKWENVVRSGSEWSKGDILLSKGSVLQGREMGLLASLGIHGITVNRKPRVSIITTGSRIVDILEEPTGGQIRNAPRYELVGLLLEAGCDLDRLVHVKDGRLGLERAIQNCARADAIIIATAPDDKHDLTVAALANTGDLQFDRVSIKPGGATAFAVVEEKPVFAIPGESVAEVFEAIVRPALLTMLGRTEVDRQIVKAETQSIIKPDPACTHILRAETVFEGKNCITRPLDSNKNKSPQWTLANSLIVIPEGSESIKRGDYVDVWMI